MSDKSYGHDLYREIKFESFYSNLELQKSTPGACLYSFHLTASKDFDAVFESNLPIVFAFVVAVIFLVMGITFFVYDSFVTRRNNKVMGAAMRSTAIVTSLFPSNVRDRLYDGAQAANHASSSAKLRRFMDKNGAGPAMDGLSQDGYGDENHDAVVLETKPIADLFPETTVMFCDIGKEIRCGSNPNDALFVGLTFVSSSLRWHSWIYGLEFGP